ncbi:HAMP domain-containing protein [Paenibacillus qinlingensis]|uniref:Methyl-accepting chemotaxis protein n=1 Tax=Paenibacillus qinlingensis TaxID=1837343 RepID=A0ABU1NTT3_9BACL|nr:HAMP domain-containing protein [Paenibacillus qinlingensis]MDR6550891.1 methyl-accepting chemotaxis protein [Paenibacillus qinlingensis]
MKITTWLKATSGVFILLSVLNGASIYLLDSSVAHERSAVEQQAVFKQLGIDLANASDYLTNEARAYVQFGDKVHYDNYWREVNETKTVDNVLAKLTQLGAPKEELDVIANAKQNSDMLVTTEEAAMKAVESKDFTKARQLMFDSNYDSSRNIIMESVQQFQHLMNTREESEATAAKNEASLLLTLTILFLVITFAILLAMIIMIFVKLKPLQLVNEKIAELAKSGGDLTARLHYTSKDEIGEISNSLNAMMEALQSIIRDVLAEESLKGVKSVNDMTVKQNILVKEVSTFTELLSKDSRNLENLVMKFKV